jgi:hypothetical protein
VTTAQPISNAGNASPAATTISFRAQAEDLAALDALCAYWQLDHSATIRRLLRLAALSPKVRHALDYAAELELGIPVPAKKWRVLRQWSGLIPNVGHLDLICDDVLGTGAARDLVAALLAHDLVEPL